MMISQPVRLPKPAETTRSEDVEGRLRVRPIVDDQQPGQVRPVKTDDTEGHSRFGFFLDADHPVDQSQPERPASQGGDVEGQQT